MKWHHWIMLGIGAYVFYALGTMDMLPIPVPSFGAGGDTE
jgi:hypothetical protein